MAKKSTTEKAKYKVAGTAKTGADAVRDIAGEAIRAAAVAAAGVALQRTADALRGGARTAESAAPKPPRQQSSARWLSLWWVCWRWQRCWERNWRGPGRCATWGCYRYRGRLSGHYYSRADRWNNPQLAVWFPKLRRAG